MRIDTRNYNEGIWCVHPRRREKISGQFLVHILISQLRILFEVCDQEFGGRFRSLSTPVKPMVVSEMEAS